MRLSVIPRFDGKQPHVERIEEIGLNNLAQYLDQLPGLFALVEFKNRVRRSSEITRIHGALLDADFAELVDGKREKRVPTDEDRVLIDALWSSGSLPGTFFYWTDHGFRIGLAYKEPAIAPDIGSDDHPVFLATQARIISACREEVARVLKGKGLHASSDDSSAPWYVEPCSDGMAQAFYAPQAQVHGKRRTGSALVRPDRLFDANAILAELEGEEPKKDDGSKPKPAPVPVERYCAMQDEHFRKVVEGGICPLCGPSTGGKKNLALLTEWKDGIPRGCCHSSRHKGKKDGGFGARKGKNQFHYFHALDLAEFRTGKSRGELLAETRPADAATNPTSPPDNGIPRRALSDQGNGDRLLSLCTSEDGTRLAYFTPAESKGEMAVWRWWDAEKRHYVGGPLAEQQVDLKARQLKKVILAEAEGIENPDARKAFESWARRSESTACKRNAKKELSTLVLAPKAEWDPIEVRREGLPCVDGLYLFTEDCVRPYTPEDRILRYVPFAPREMPTPAMDKVMQHTFPDASVREYVWRRLAMCLRNPITGARRATFLVGPTQNGKSTTINAFRRAFGGKTAFASSFDLEALNQPRGGNRPTPALIPLRGRLLACASEAERRATTEISGALLKNYLGGEDFSVRDLYLPQDEWLPTADFVIAVNDLPRVPDGDAAIWERVVAIPASGSTIPKTKRRDLAAEQDAEAPGVLWRLLAVLRRMGESPHEGVCSAVEAETATWTARSSGPYVRWFMECVEPHPDYGSEHPMAFLPTAYLMREFNSWVEGGGTSVGSAKQCASVKAFGRHLSAALNIVARLRPGWASVRLDRNTTGDQRGLRGVRVRASYVEA